MSESLVSGYCGGIDTIQLPGVSPSSIFAYRPAGSNELWLTVTIQPLRSWPDRVASKCAAQHFHHAVALFALLTNLLRRPFKLANSEILFDVPLIDNSHSGFNSQWKYMETNIKVQRSTSPQRHRA
jgi:hypothetical protein